MIVELTPRIKFVCDRCGKEEFPDENGALYCRRAVFREDDPIMRPKDKAGDICMDCLAEFWELADNFFDEVNKEKADEGGEG